MTGKTAPDAASAEQVQQLGKATTEVDLGTGRRALFGVLGADGGAAAVGAGVVQQPELVQGMGTSARPASAHRFCRPPELVSFCF